MKYVKMKSMLPEGAVRQKMTNDGFAAADIDAFLAGKVSSLPTPVPGANAPARPPMAQMLAQGAPLRAPPPPRAAPASAAPRRMSLLEEIQQGPRLKAVVKDDSRQQPAAITGGGGLLGMLALEMSKRRFNMSAQQEDSDSDSGFSDSDSDSD